MQKIQKQAAWFIKILLNVVSEMTDAHMHLNRKEMIIKIWRNFWDVKEKRSAAFVTLWMLLQTIKRHELFIKALNGSKRALTLLLVFLLFFSFWTLSITETRCFLTRTWPTPTKTHPSVHLALLSPEPPLFFFTLLLHSPSSQTFSLSEEEQKKSREQTWNPINRTARGAERVFGSKWVL